MKKIMPIAFLGLILAPIITFAGTQGFVSSLSISANSLAHGQNRKYEYDNHKITIEGTSINYGYDETGLVIALYKDKLIGSTQQSRKTAYISQDETVTTIMGSHGSGKKSYSFGTYQNALKDGNEGHGVQYPGLSSDYVYMISYS